MTYTITQIKIIANTITKRNITKIFLIILCMNHFLNI